MATKERRKAPPRAPKYHRLIEEKRIIIETLRKEGYSNRQITQSNREARSGPTKGTECQRERRRAPTLARLTVFLSADWPDTDSQPNLLFSCQTIRLRPTLMHEESNKFHIPHISA